MRFEKVSFDAFRKDGLKYGWTEEAIRVAYGNIKLPERQTEGSAGYDFFTCFPIILHPKHSIIVPTGIKAYFSKEDAKCWHLSLHVRSSVGSKQGVILSNGTGIIDGDYYGNPDNEGGILMAFYNRSNDYRRFEVGERLMQGLFELHALVDGDNVTAVRKGGVGSTNG